MIANFMDAERHVHYNEKDGYFIYFLPLMHLSEDVITSIVAASNGKIALVSVDEFFVAPCAPHLQLTSIRSMITSLISYQI